MMKKTAARKSTAFVTLVLVPLNLMGLGFTGCDSGDDAPSFEMPVNDPAGQDQQKLDFAEPDDGYNLDPVPPTDFRSPATLPSTRPAAQTAFAQQPSYHTTHGYSHHSGFLFLPIPYRAGYVPPYYRPGSPGYAHSSGSTFSRSSSSTFSRSGSSRSSGSSSSSSSHSSGVSRSSGTSSGGFGSTGHSMSHSSSSS